METKQLARVLTAAAIVVVVAAAVAIAGTRSLEVELEDGDSQMVMINRDGAIDRFQLDDLADGEERRFEAGEHELVVRRDGNRLRVVMDGDELGLPGDGGHAAIWLEDEGAGNETRTAQRIIVKQLDDGNSTAAQSYAYTVGTAGDCDIDIEAMLDHEALAGLEGLHDVKVLMKRAGDGPGCLAHHGLAAESRAVFRCEESGSVLVVKEDDALFDSYVDPATGCLMERIEGDEGDGVKVVTIVHRLGDGEGDDLE